MKNLKKIVLTTLLSAGLMGTAFVAQADNKSRSQDAQAISTASVSINKAVEIALAAVPGAVTEAEFEVEDGKSIWEVEVLDANQQMYKIEIDANSGDVLENKLDDGKGKRKGKGKKGGKRGKKHGKGHGKGKRHNNKGGDKSMDSDTVSE